LICPRRQLDQLARVAILGGAHLVENALDGPRPSDLPGADLAMAIGPERRCNVRLGGTVSLEPFAEREVLATGAVVGARSDLVARFPCLCCGWIGREHCLNPGGQAALGLSASLVHLDLRAVEGLGHIAQLERRALQGHAGHGEVAA
jgi:hypothetical protein